MHIANLQYMKLLLETMLYSHNTFQGKRWTCTAAAAEMPSEEFEEMQKCRYLDLQNFHEFHHGRDKLFAAKCQEDLSQPGARRGEGLGRKAAEGALSVFDL